MLLKFKDLWKKIIIIIMVLLISTSTFAKPQKTDAFALELWMLGVMATMLVGGGIVFTQEPTQEFLTDTFYSLSSEVQQGISNAQSLGSAFFMVGVNEYRKFLDDIYTLYGISSLSSGSSILLDGYFTPDLNHINTTFENYSGGLMERNFYTLNTIKSPRLNKFTREPSYGQSVDIRVVSNRFSAQQLTNIVRAQRNTSNLYSPYVEVNQYIDFIDGSYVNSNLAGQIILATITECIAGCSWLTTPNYDGKYAEEMLTDVAYQGYPQNTRITYDLLLSLGFGILSTSPLVFDTALPLPGVWEDLDENEKDEALKDGFANHNGKLILGGAAAAIGSAIGTLTPPLVRDVPKDGSWLEDLTDEDINNIGLAGVIAAFAQLINSLVKKITDTFDKPSPSPGNVDLLKTTIMMKVPCMTEFTGAFEQIMELQGETPVHTFTLFGKQYTFEYYKLFEGFIHVSSYIKQFFNFILWFLFLRGGIRRITSTLSGGTTEGNDQ